MTTIINVTGALWYIAETAMPEATKIRVFNFGYNKSTICETIAGVKVNCALAIDQARNGLAIVYVPLGTPKKNNTYVPDETPYRLALSMVLSIGVLVLVAARLPLGSQ